uniref:SEC7 domain-containing protein n=1 Tax=Kalanchoe fedtschenkoi TaxID=63787 RepID=A0A7N0V2E3_KALFE
MGLVTTQSKMDSLHHKSRDCASHGAYACIINTEISAVLAVMRRNVRWGVRYLGDDIQMEHPLIHSLKKLRKEIFSWQNQWESTNPAAYLQPFLDVIQSDETGAPITGVALSSVYKILTLDILNEHTANVEDAMALIVDAVTSCRFEVTDPASEEVVLMKILQVLMACMKSKASKKLNNQHVCNILNACFRVVHQASSKGELLQRIARHTLHEMVRCIFSRLPDIATEEHTNHTEGLLSTSDEPVSSNSLHFSDEQNTEDVKNYREQSGGDASNASTGEAEPKVDNGSQMEDVSNEEQLMTKPFGTPCMVEIFHFLCSLLNVIENIESGSRSNPIAYEEDVPLFSLGLINSAIELGGDSFARHPKLLALIQDELFQNLMQFGLSMSPLVLSTVCSIVLNLYYHMRTELKMQLEAFFSFVLLRVAHNKHGYSYQQQEVAMEAIVDLCRRPSFVTEIYANYDCHITCNNVFEDIANLLSKSAFPVNSPLSAVNLLALDGLIAILQGMANRGGDENPFADQILLAKGYKSFWTEICESYHDLDLWIPSVRKMKYIKRRLMVGADHFNRNSKKGLQFLQELHLLPEKLDPQSVAYFFRCTISLDKNVMGDFLGSHDDFCVQVLEEFAKTFDFEGMSLDGALRLFLGTFRLPGESQKIQRVLEAFAERYYEQCPHILSNKDAALVLSYSIILLNTDQHNLQVKRKMTEEDFIRNNRCINAGKDLPREFLSELYQSISENEIQMLPDQGAELPVMTSSRWISLLHSSKKCSPFILCDSTARLDYDMFTVLAGPFIAAISVVIDNTEHEEVIQTCIDGFMNIAKISACYHLNDILDNLVVSLCKFTTLLDPSSVEESIIALVEDNKARMATTSVFTIANKYGDCIRAGWKNIVDCVLYLHKLGLLRLADGTADDGKPSPESEKSALAVSSQSAPPALTSSTSRKSSGLIGRFSQLFSFDPEEPIPRTTLEELESQQQALQTIQSCQIGSIFMESKFLQADSLLQLVQALILAAGRLQKGFYSREDEDTAVFCLGLLIETTVNNRDRIMLLWQYVYEHVANVVQSTVMPCTLVEKAVFGLLQICQRLLPYKENLTDELLKSLRLVLKLDARVADVYCEHITQEVMHLVKANAPQIRSHVGWRTIISLLSITAQHPEASEAGFDTLFYIMSDAAHLSPANYILCVDAARQFAESRVGMIDRSVRALDLMADSFVCLIRWSSEAKQAVGDDATAKVYQDIGEMWMRLVQGLKRLGLDQREQVRNYGILLLQRCLIGVEGISLPQELWLQCFDTVIFALLDDLLKLGQGSFLKDYRNMEGTFVLAIKLLSKVFLQLLQNDPAPKYLINLWEGYLDRMESYMKAKFRGRRSDNVHQVVPELLKNTLLIMKAKGILVPNDAAANGKDDDLWRLTWSHVNNISPSLQLAIFSSQELEQLQSSDDIRTVSVPPPSDGAVLVPANKITRPEILVQRKLSHSLGFVQTLTHWENL